MPLSAAAILPTLAVPGFANIVVPICIPATSCARSINGSSGCSGTAGKPNFFPIQVCDSCEGGISVKSSRLKPAPDNTLPCITSAGKVNPLRTILSGQS